MTTMQRAFWNGPPEPLPAAFRLTKLKPGRTLAAVAEVWTHPLGWELRLMIEGHGLQMSSVVRSAAELQQTADRWQGRADREGLGRSMKPAAPTADNPRMSLSRLGPCALLAWAVLVAAACSGSPQPPAQPPARPEIPAPASRDIVLPAQEKPASSNRPMKEFTFVVQGGQRVIATTVADGSATGKPTVLFTPFLERTDGNMYNAALQILSNLYGKKRGLFQLGDARLRPNAALGGNAICWVIENPTADYCVFPTKDEATGRLAALTVWVE